MRSQKRTKKQKLWKQRGCSGKMSGGTCKMNGGCGCGGQSWMGGGYAPYPGSHTTPPNTLIPLNKYPVDLQSGHNVTQENNWAVNKSIAYNSKGGKKGYRNKNKKTQSRKQRGRSRYTRKRGGGTGFLQDSITNLFRVSGTNMYNTYNGLTGRPQLVSPLPFQDQLTRTTSFFPRNLGTSTK